MRKKTTELLNIKISPFLLNNVFFYLGGFLIYLWDMSTCVLEIEKEEYANAVARIV